MRKLLEYWPAIAPLAMVAWGAIALYFCFGGTFEALLSALPF